MKRSSKARKTPARTNTIAPLFHALRKEVTRVAITTTRSALEQAPVIKRNAAGKLIKFLEKHV